jgi:chemotaxis protein histidine kinase CheA
VSKTNHRPLTFFEPGGEPAGIDQGPLERARTANEKFKRAYFSERAPTAIDELERALLMARSSPEFVAEQPEIGFRLAHDMKGQGATFGFCLISDIGAAFCNLTHNRISATSAKFEAMLAHVHAARAVISEELEDPNSEAAVAMMAHLNAKARGNLH